MIFTFPFEHHYSTAVKLQKVNDLKECFIKSTTIGLPLLLQPTQKLKVADFSSDFYLLTTLLYGEGELAHYHIYTLQCGLLQLLDLLFHYGLKGQVRGEEPRPARIGKWHGRKELKSIDK